MVKALFLAFSQLSDPPVRRVVWFGIGLAVAGFLVLAVAIGALLNHIDLTPLPWLHAVITALGEIGVMLMAWLLFPAVAAAMSSLLLDDVIAAVEHRYYPTLPPPRSPTLSENLSAAARLIGVMVALNLAVLPLYLVPGLNVLVFYALNGYVLGREYFELAAIRRLDLSSARALRRRHRVRLFIAGVIITVLSTIPFVNLIVPVIASAFMVHVFHDLNAGLRPVR